LLECAALAGAPFHSDWLGAIEADAFARLDTLEAACRAGLLEAVAGGFTFRHDLLRRALEQSLSLERRRALHGSLADRLQSVGASPERIADHLERAGGGVAAIPHLERAADAASRVYARREALAYVERILKFELDAEQRWPLEVKRVGLLRDLTDLYAYRASLDRLERLAQVLGQPDRRAQAHLWRGVYHLWHGQPEAVVAQAQQALALPDLGDALEAEGLYLLGYARARLGQVRLGLDCLERAAECARRDAQGRPEERIGMIENALSGAYQYLGEYGRALEHNARAEGVWRQVSESLAVFSLGSRGLLELLLGRFGAARETLENVIPLALGHGHLSAASFAYRNRASLLLVQGQGRAAALDIQESLRLCRGKNLRLEAQLTGLQARRNWFEGQLGAALDALSDGSARAEKLRVAPLIAELRVTLAGFLAELGQDIAAKAELEALRQLAVELGDDGVLRPYSAIMDVILARNELRRGNPDRAAERLRATPHLENAPFVDRATHALELARAMTRSGEALGALEKLQSLQVVPPLEPLLVSVRLEAHAKIGQIPAASLERALDVFTLDCAAPTERLELTLHLAPALAGRSRELSEVLAWSRATLEALALSLESHPELRLGLLERFAPLLDR
jgi:tetratricopeptide (TPR) repeat protein